MKFYTADFPRGCRLSVRGTCWAFGLGPAPTPKYSFTRCWSGSIEPFFETTCPPMGMNHQFEKSAIGILNFAATISGKLPGGMKIDTVRSV